jgi:hypothetical protein
MKKGRKYYDLERAEITFVVQGNTTFLRTTGDGSRSNNLSNIPQTDLVLSK